MKDKKFKIKDSQFIVYIHVEQTTNWSTKAVSTDSWHS